MKVRAYIVAAFFALVLCLGFNSTASAAHFEDVDPAFPGSDAVYALADAGVFMGTGSTTFSPKEPVTANQVLVTYGRLAGWDLSNVDGLVEYLKGQHIWPYAMGLNEIMTRERLITLVFRLTGALPSCNTAAESIYTDAQGVAYAEMVIEDMDFMDVLDLPDGPYVSRLDYAVFLNAVRDDLMLGDASFVKQLGFGYIPVAAGEKYESKLGAMYGHMLNVPLVILRTYHNSGFTIMFDDAYIDEYIKQSGVQNVVGLFSTKTAAIYVTKPYAIIHEMGHFVETYMAGRDDIVPCFRADAEAAQQLYGVSSYALENEREYFGEIFRFFVLNRGDVQQMDSMRVVTPSTYEYFTKLAYRGWVKAA